MWQCQCGMENADQIMNCEKCHYNRDYVKRMREAEEHRRGAKLASVEEESHKFDTGLLEAVKPKRRMMRIAVTVAVLSQRSGKRLKR